MPEVRTKDGWRDATREEARAFDIFTSSPGQFKHNKRPENVTLFPENLTYQLIYYKKQLICIWIEESREWLPIREKLIVGNRPATDAQREAYYKFLESGDTRPGLHKIKLDKGYMWVDAKYEGQGNLTGIYLQGRTPDPTTRKHKWFQTRTEARVKPTDFTFEHMAPRSAVCADPSN
jgi:hypothetical protein